MKKKKQLFIMIVQIIVNNCYCLKQSPMPRKTEMSVKVSNFCFDVLT